MTASPSDTNEATGTDGLEDFATQIATAVGGTVAEAKGIAKVKVPASAWRSALQAARDELGLIFFSFLSAIDWTPEVAVGDPHSDPGPERFELLCTVGDLSQGRSVTFSTDLDHEDPSINSLVPVYPGAEWHEREAYEMFGINFVEHPNLIHLYLPEGFIGNPLRKSYPLLSREVKPWPGDVDVEGMPGSDTDEPATENPEA